MVSHTAWGVGDFKLRQSTATCTQTCRPFQRHPPTSLNPTTRVYLDTPGPMSWQPGQSRSQDLSVAPLPLTQTQRDEFDQVILGAIHPDDLRIMQDSEAADTGLDRVFSTFLATTYVHTINFFNRHKLENVLDHTKFMPASLEQHPQLSKVIHDACRTGLYSRILDLKIMQMSDTSSPTRPELAQGKDEFEFLYNSFVRPYIGEAVDGFYEYLKKNDKKFKGSGLRRPYYAKFCSIVQSSGTGKSRLMTEVGILKCIHVSDG
ncbi:uncharacterized protein BJ212DRAFT_602442 [Suillus subaureus]|uniref:Uncharacterized protein n=1 Tax=Suillus subaureus TaxID=48587 RepID=A0A9P7E1V2_9AGAM|nr:uncharacterized protein BJ212DRAFT_602442 [Suillus subaureus]KAG1809294.1 hypothetical protein BJ212DRAFT_602442 [Suillus subaureus]